MWKVLQKIAVFVSGVLFALTFVLHLVGEPIAWNICIGTANLVMGFIPTD